ncbi:hypothetical protein CMV_024637 [Castanea mollissima]|uniref:BED-type domain-containing protein n=1 Tax=Castanea mollissima TaxID=60419 RepID=A0A8J4V9F3_9ROSI|nr:hypothetical protein CMV_024637 [Castanea mollissima]
MHIPNPSSMSLDSLEPSPISQTKQDPAWKHCQLFVKKNANGVKEELKKCTYCGKFFKGGGIHRIKEHLAGRKGNGPTCDQVPPEVRIFMKQVLNARNSGTKKNKTEIIISTAPSVDHTPLKLIEAPDLGNESIDRAFLGSTSTPNLDLLVNQEEDVATSNVSVDVRKRRRGLNASVLDPSASANSNGGIDFSSPSPVPCEIDNVFANHARSISGGAPNSKVLVNHDEEEEEEEIGIGGTSMDRKKRFRGENSLVAMDAGIVNNDIELERKNNQEIQMAIGRFLYEIGAPLDAVKDSVYFQPMIDAIVSGGTGVVLPSYHDLRGWILKSAVEEVKHDVQQYMGTWRRTGCSILVNRWYSQRGKTFLTFSVYCPERTLFLKYVDASAIIYSPDALYELLKQVVEEVGVGHVLQVITDNTEKFIVAGKSIKGCIHNGIMSAMFDCIERLVPDTKVQDKIIKEMNSYKNAVGDLGRNLAIRSRDTLLPVEWWSTYGGGCPNLARLAVRILSQTCSSISYKQSQISFEHIYETRNCLERQRFSDLFFVQCNLRLRQMVHKNKEQDYMDPISFDCMSLVEDWLMEKEVCFEDCGSSDWVSLNPPTTNTMQLGALVDDDAEDLGTGFDDNEIFDKSK